MRPQIESAALRAGRKQSSLIISVVKAIDGQGVTALHDRIGNHPSTLPLQILGLAVIEQTFQLKRLSLCPAEFSQFRSAKDELQKYIP